MRQSQLFTKTRKEAPSDEVAKNAKLLIRGGFIHKEMAGVYSFLPLGLRVLNRIVGIIREEMNALGGIELELTALQDRSVWEKSGRWDDKAVDSWFKTSIRSGGEAGLGFTHEEPLTRIMRDHISSYRDLPRYVYQIQTKFRNEERAKSGLLRGREFLMKDLYSFCRDEREHQAFYEQAKAAYSAVFKRVGIGEKTFLTFASGGSFSKYSHEFQTLCESGEDAIHFCGKCAVAVNEEIIGEQPACPQCGNKALQRHTAVEVGNIFTLGTRFSEALGLAFLDERGEKHFVFMGSYGLGPSRLLGTVAELFGDDKGIIWPEEVAPFQIHLIALAGPNKGEEVVKASDALYAKLAEKGVDALYDDRDLRPGEKFADADLIGIPTRVVVSDKTLKESRLEVKNRVTGAISMLSESDLLKLFS